MKKTIFLVVLISFLTILVSGCFGSFTLTRKVYDFNRSLDEKFLQSLVMWAMYIVPVYPFATTIDVVILNLIEFWSGANPLAMNDNDVEQKYYSLQDKTYEVVTSKNRYDITEIDNPVNSFSLVFNNDDTSWYLHSKEQIIRLTAESKSFLKLYNFEGNLMATL